MSIISNHPESEADSPRNVWAWGQVIFLRILAMFFLVLAIQYWMRAVGIYGDGSIRFDTMPTHWRVAISALAILHPVTALGLWGLFSWGIAVWLINLAIQVVMHVGFAGNFGSEPLLMSFHLTCFAVFVIMHIALRVTANKS